MADDRDADAALARDLARERVRAHASKRKRQRRNDTDRKKPQTVPEIAPPRSRHRSELLPKAADGLHHVRKRGCAVRVVARRRGVPECGIGQTTRVGQ